MRLVFKSFLGLGKSSKIGRGHLSGEASEAKNWMFGMLGKRSKVRLRYGCLSGERRRYDVRGHGVSEWAWREGAPLFPGCGHAQYVKLHSVRLNVARHSDVEIGFLGKVRGVFTLNLWSTILMRVTLTRERTGILGESLWSPRVAELAMSQRRVELACQVWMECEDQGQVSGLRSLGTV